jgi:hypothetical protein
MMNDIRLAKATIELVNRRALREPADGDKHERSQALYATIRVRSSELSPERIRDIAHSYALLDVDGYWIWAVDFEAYVLRAERMLGLVVALQEASGGNAPTRPSMNGRSLVLWIGDHTSAILNEPGRDVVGTGAMRLANASRNVYRRSYPVRHPTSQAGPHGPSSKPGALQLPPTAGMSRGQELARPWSPLKHRVDRREVGVDLGVPDRDH